MALHFVLQINGQPIGACVIQRHEDLDLTDPDAIADTVSTYDVTVHEQRTNHHERTAVVRHRYGDGAWALVRAGLNAAFDDEQAAVPSSTGYTLDCQGCGHQDNGLSVDEARRLVLAHEQGRHNTRVRSAS